METRLHWPTGKVTLRTLKLQVHVFVDSSGAEAAAVSAEIRNIGNTKAGFILCGVAVIPFRILFLLCGAVHAAAVQSDHVFSVLEFCCHCCCSAPPVYNKRRFLLDEVGGK